jgi:hypothetical protein
MISSVAIWLVLLFYSPAARLRAQAAGAYQPANPRVWADAALKDLPLPLARAEYTPKHVPQPATTRYPSGRSTVGPRVPSRLRAEAGNIEWLRSREPELA